jgi:hypothetical protein
MEVESHLASIYDQNSNSVFTEEKERLKNLESAK